MPAGTQEVSADGHHPLQLEDGHLVDGMMDMDLTLDKTNPSLATIDYFFKI